MSEADSEDRDPDIGQGPDRLDRILARFRVARSVGQKDTIRHHFHDLLCRCRRRHDRQSRIIVGDDAQNVALDTKVEGDDMKQVRLLSIDRLALRPVTALLPLVRLLRRYELREVHTLETRKLLCRRQRFFFVGVVARDDAPGQGALVTNRASQFACVDLGNRDRLAASQKFLQRDLCAPVTDDAGRVPDN